MSIHARPSTEALAALEIQKRNSTLSAIAIAILSMVLLIMVLGAIFLPAIIKNDPGPMITPVRSEPVEPETNRPTISSLRKPASPASQSNPMLRTNFPAPVSVPVPDLDAPPAQPGFGIDDGDFGSGIGPGPGDGGYPPGPPVVSKRCSAADRRERLEKTGGSPECEDAVLKGLRWLKATQLPNGSWPGPSANTGFAILCYLGHCATPADEEFGDSCLRGLVYLIDLGMARNGKLAPSDKEKHWPYEHAINTYALAEAVTMCRQAKPPIMDIPHLEEVVQQAGQFIIDNQTAPGGWEYSYSEVSQRGGGDLSITAWQLQALKACSLTELDFRNLKRAAKRGVDYVKNLAGPDGAFGYSAPGAHHGDYGTLTGAGVLCMQQWDQDSAKEVRNGAKYIEGNTRFEFNTRFADLYGHYYEAQAMMNRGGEQWKKYNTLFRDQLLANQAADGSWKKPGGGQPLRAVAPAYESDVHYRTVLCILMLEVYYRYLPATSGVR